MDLLDAHRVRPPQQPASEGRESGAWLPAGGDPMPDQLLRTGDDEAGLLFVLKPRGESTAAYFEPDQSDSLEVLVDWRDEPSVVLPGQRQPVESYLRAD